MRSVNAQKYNSEYFLNILNYVNYDKPVAIKDFKFIHQHLVSIFPHTKKDFVVDYGCGNGDLTFLLAMMYRCRVLGIDYSPDAIQIANENKKLLKETGSLNNKNVSFICTPNNKVPALHNVTSVYLADVIEHLYDEEIDIIVKKFIQWNDNIKIVVHTDNSSYVYYVRPLIDLLTLIAGKTSIQSIKNRNSWERDRHVNLMTPRILSQKLKKYGFKVVKVEYSPVSIKRIQTQLGLTRASTFIAPIMLNIGKIFNYLLPSFYMVLERNN